MTRDFVVTITGLDDYTDYARCLKLTMVHPFLEWGVLHSNTKAGCENRYPRHALAHLAQHPNGALHLCGQSSREIQQGIDNLGFVAAAHGKRMQLNGYSGDGGGLLRRIEGDWAWRGVEFILQCRSRRDLVQFAGDVDRIRQNGGKASLLFDPSGGRGIDCLDAIMNGPPLECRQPFGIAGGIGPGKISRAIQVAFACGASWIDMESRVRSETDLLDLDRVTDVLEAARIELAQRLP